MIGKQKSEKLQVQDDASGKITKSLSLWNSMIAGLSKRTDLDISQLQPEIRQSRDISNYNST